MSSSHLKRWLTALVALPLLVLLIGKGGPVWFALVVALLGAVGMMEYYTLVLPKETWVLRATGLAFSVALVISLRPNGVTLVPFLLFSAFVASAAICLLRFPSPSVPEMLYKQMAGLIYIPFLLGHLILIRESSSGVSWIFFLLAVVFAGDTAAYYVGHALGRHKLAPKISPGKTVEGALGGLAANLVIGIVSKIFWFPEFGWFHWIALVLVMGISGQVGDLVESMLKRSVDIKDSGGIFPGHGGILDRIDALFFAAPVLYYFKTYIM
jgi:phosphatidate cytidylyltransferase